jgi:hypothetical protein
LHSNNRGFDPDGAKILTDSKNSLKEVPFPMKLVVKFFLLCFALKHYPLSHLVSDPGSIQRRYYIFMASFTKSVGYVAK